jgi:hypothetical protein
MRKGNWFPLGIALVWLVCLVTGCGGAASPAAPALPPVEAGATALAPARTPVEAGATVPVPARTPAAGASAAPASSARPAVPTATPTAAQAADTRAFGLALAQSSPFEAPAQGGGAPEVGSAWTLLFPELGNAQAPGWLREGMRLTYYGQSATLAEAEDERSGAAGYVQCDVVALDADAAVLSVKLYLGLGGGAVVPSFVLPSFGLPGAGDYWLAPEVLADAERVANDELTVVPDMPAQAMGRTTRAVRFEYRPPGAVYVWMFEAESGVLLFYRHAIGEEGAAQRQVADLTLVAQRQVALPWRGQSAPAWVVTGSALRYDGTYSALAMGAPAGSFPYTVLAEAQRRGARWTEHRLSAFLAGAPSGAMSRVTGVAQLTDALWLPPEALGALRDGQVLDRDPMTGAQVEVSRPGDGTLVLTEWGAAYYTALGYDEGTGVLVSTEQEVRSGAATTRISLRLTEGP